MYRVGMLWAVCLSFHQHTFLAMWKWNVLTIYVENGKVIETGAYGKRNKSRLLVLPFHVILVQVRAVELRGCSIRSAWENAKGHILSTVTSVTWRREENCVKLHFDFYFDALSLSDLLENKQVTKPTTKFFFLSQTKMDPYIKLIFCPGLKSKITYLAENSFKKQWVLQLK